MAAEVDEYGFIPLIHNYCDRWCERCAFTSRCRSYAIQMSVAVEGLDGGLSAAAANLPSAADAAEGEMDLPEEWEEDPELDAEVEEILLEHDAAHLAAEVHPLTEGADALARLAGPLIEGAARRMDEGGPQAEAFRDPFEVLSWYRFFVSAKVRRALAGRERPPILDEQGRPFPSDADGSAKIAHIACTAARKAARRLADLDPALAPAATAYTQAADRVLELIDETLPGHRTFRRPGFDDPLPA